jgi:hypothetical protein
LFDEVSGGLLGIFAITDAHQNNPYMEDKFGWHEIDMPDRHAGQIRNKAKFNGLHTIIVLRRCLPLFEFGQMLGGKLLTLAALSNELIRALEVQYSFKVSMMYAKALHGKSSQYNRLQSHGFMLDGIDINGSGYYMSELRKGAYSFLRGDKPKMGKSKLKKYADNVEFWRERWLLPRAESRLVTDITFDLDRYRLSNLLKQRGIY